ncbi:hypothetical protein GCM10022280_24340 [Sphingomonas swuensis]|uniref:Uncharacterized protein n=2 Tax=Sphingomonas swuensis TaxID=977800 RepID=A0ABP7T9C2_9SPHN
MMKSDDRFAPRPLARWYWVGAIAVLLFMLMGCAGYLVSVFTPLDQLPADQRALMEARPVWMIAAYAIAVWVGLLGAIALLARRKVAVPLLLVSLVGAIFTFLPYAVVPRVRELATENDGAVGIVVTALVWTSFWFARHSQQRGWLR